MVAVLLLCGRAHAFMPMLGNPEAAISGPTGTCDCESNKINEISTPLSLQSTSQTYSQSFPAPASGTNVKITVRTSSVNGSPSSASILLDDDRDFSADLLGSDTSVTVPSSHTEFSTVITASTALVEGETYYFLVKNNDADYADRFYLRANTGDYDTYNYCNKGSGDLDHSSGATCANVTTGNDLYFEVCVGDGCE